MNTADKILTAVNHHKPDKELLIFDDEIITQAEFLKKISQIKNNLIEYGLKSGDKVLISSSLGIDYWIALVAAWSLNATVIPLDPSLDQSRAQKILEIAQPQHLIGSINNSTVNQFLEEYLLNAPTSKRNIKSSIENNEHPAAILFTSGSTGVPKGVVLTHQALIHNSLATLDVIKLNATHRLLVATAPYFTSALSHFLAVMLSGGTFMTTSRLLMQADLVKFFMESGANAFGGSPIQAHWLATCFSAASKPKLDWVMSSGDYLTRNTIDIFLNEFPQTRLYTVYGLTELAGRFCILPAEQLAEYPGSVGKPISCLSLTIRDENGALVPPYEKGEIYAQGDTLLTSYYGNESQTSSCLSLHGFKTGDIGYVNENGMLYLSGRKDDVFKCAGQKVSALNIFETIEQLKIFDDLAVLAIKDDLLGHVPCIYYVSKATQKFSKAEIMKKLRGILSGVDMPKQFVEVPVIPRTGSGKVDRNALIKCGI